MYQAELEHYEHRANACPNPVLCFQTRSGITENVHRGVVCCIEATSPEDYRIIYQTGNIDQLFFPRSAVKYVQVLPLLEAGCAEHYGFTKEEIAVMCASHSALPEHLRVVRSILAKAGVSEADLQCGGHTPGCEDTAFAYVRQGEATPFTGHIYNNCSGKHAGFLALCKYRGFPLTGYLEPSHPLQALVRAALSDVFCIPLAELRMGTDGCSAPAPIMTVRNAALGFARLCNPSLLADSTRRKAVLDMISAITAHPMMVYDAKGFDTVLMDKLRGKVIGKRGAAGGFISGLVGRSIGCAVKIDDGLMLPQYNVTMQMLRWIYSGARAPAVRGSALGLATTTGASLLPALAVCEEECGEALQQLSEMESFFLTPSINSMKVRVGALACVPLRFPPQPDPATG